MAGARRRRKPVRRQRARPINLALQGGGAHGAFTWGVLDRLLEDSRIEIDGISGTSAGSVNGLMVAYGMALGGRDEARHLLAELWRRIGQAARFSPFQPCWIDRMMGGGNLDFSPGFQAFDLMSRVVSPYQFNPLDLNPLRDLVSELVDFDRLRASDTVKLFVSTTDVRSGKIRVFGPKELRPEVFMASACLPLLFKAVEIDGEFYWDGGYMGNPALFPLIYNCRASDIMLVEINPIRIEQVPTDSRAILDRMNDISFNATMMREMRAIAFVTRMLDHHRLNGGSGLRRINFHMVQAEKAMGRYGASSKFNTDPGFLDTLFRLGRETAADWLDEHFGMIGRDSSVDLHHLFF